MSISHWWVITLTTTGTVSFLVAKVLKFEVSFTPSVSRAIYGDSRLMVGAVLQFNKFQPLTYNVMLVLLSFIISWGEVWFFDLRMIPLERKAREIWGDYQVKVSRFTEISRNTIFGEGASSAFTQRIYLRPYQKWAFKHSLATCNSVSCFKDHHTGPH